MIVSGSNDVVQPSGGGGGGGEAPPRVLTQVEGRGMWGEGDR